MHLKDFFMSLIYVFVPFLTNSTGWKRAQAHAAQLSVGESVRRSRSRLIVTAPLKEACLVTYLLSLALTPAPGHILTD